VQTAIDEQVDFVVLAGDIYDTAERDPGAQRRFLLGLRRLTESGIRVFMVHGNHDPLTRDIKNGLLPEGVVVFPAGKLGVETVTMRNGVEVVVAGVSYSKKEEDQNLVPLFAELTGKTVIGVLHTNVGGNEQHGNYAPCSVSDLENSPVNYWALGHIHLRTVKQTPRGWWAYPGNLQGRSMKASESGPKGVLIVEVDDDGSISEPRFVECSMVRFARVDVRVDEVTEASGVDDAVVQRLRELVSEASGIPHLVRLELTGQTDISALLNSDEWDEDQTVDEGNQVLDGGAIVKVKFSCVPRVDLAQERSRGTLLGTVLNELDKEDLPEDVRDAASAILVNTLGRQP
jgi:DNA repair exonuclease SbcCD nuclease subunit